MVRLRSLRALEQITIKVYTILHLYRQIVNFRHIYAQSGAVLSPDTNPSNLPLTGEDYQKVPLPAPRNPERNRGMKWGQGGFRGLK